MKKIISLIIIFVLIALIAFWWFQKENQKVDTPQPDTPDVIGEVDRQPDQVDQSEPPETIIRERTFYDDLSDAAIERTMHKVTYDPKYVKLKYPMGDVPADTGVCTDVVIRSYRRFGVDLQQLVHEDIKKRFKEYPATKVWGSKRPDANIDHRRVYNLQAFFDEFAELLPLSQEAKDYQPGDIVTWQVSPKFPHIGIVVDVASGTPDRYMVVHNIGSGPKIDDILFAFPITGHYRYDLDMAGISKIN